MCSHSLTETEIDIKTETDQMAAASNDISSGIGLLSMYIYTRSFLLV